MLTCPPFQTGPLLFDLLKISLVQLAGYFPDLFFFFSGQFIM